LEFYCGWLHLRVTEIRKKSTMNTLAMMPHNSS